MLRIDAIVQSTLDLILEEPVNPEATEWRHPSILHCGGENGALGMRLTDKPDLESPRERLWRQRQEWMLVLCRSKASRQAAQRGTPGSHIQEKVLHPGDSSDCGHPNVRSSASSFEMPSLNKGQKGTTSRLPESPRAPSYLKFPSRKRWVAYKRVLTAMFFFETLPPWLK